MTSIEELGRLDDRIYEKFKAISTLSAGATLSVKLIAFAYRSFLEPTSES